MSDEQKVVVGAVVVGALLLLWFASLAVSAVRNRRPHGGAVTRAAETVRSLDAGDRPDQIELTEHVAWFDKCDPKAPEYAPAVGRRGYLALTKTHLLFVPYHRSDPVVLDRTRLSSPASRYKKVWKRSRASFSLRYAPTGGAAPVTLSFKVREAYTWLYHFGYRSGLQDDPYS